MNRKNFQYKGWKMDDEPEEDEKEIAMEDFVKMQEEHQHHHH